MKTAKTPTGCARRFLILRWVLPAVLAFCPAATGLFAQSDNDPPALTVVVEAPEANSFEPFNPDFNTPVTVTGRVIGPEPLEVDEARFLVNQMAFVPPGLDFENRFTMNWNPPAPGLYEIVAEVDFEGNTVSSNPVTFFVTGVDMDMPLAGTKIPGGSTVRVRGDAYSPDGVPIESVEYFADGESIGAAAHFPYTVFWTVPETASVQSAELTAEVTYSDGQTAPSTSRFVDIVPRASEPPTVAITNPSEGDTVSVPESGGFVAIKAEAEASGSLENVEFFVDGRSVGLVEEFPLEVLWEPRFSGDYTLHALARDDKGNATLSEPVNMTVSGDLPPAPPPGVDFTATISGWEGRVSPSGGPDEEVFSLSVNVESTGASYPATPVQDNASVYLIPAVSGGTEDGDEFLVGRFTFSVPAGQPNAPTVSSNPFSTRINPALNAEAVFGSGLTESEKEANRPPPGDYFLQIRVDGGSQPLGAVFVSEDPDIEVTALPDLAFQEEGADGERGLEYRGGSYRPGELVGDLAVSYKNIGNAPISEDYFVEIRLSSDTVYGNEDDFLLTRIPGSELDVDGPITDTGRVTVPLPDVKVPGNFPAGSYFVVAKLDSMDEQGELNAADNVFVDSETAKITIEPEDFPFTNRMSESAGGEEGNRLSDNPAVSADGRYVAFDSNADNLVADDSNGTADVFVRDTVTGSIVRISAGTDGGPADGPSVGPAISADGRYVAFVSDATNLVDEPLNGRSAVYLHDRDVNNSGVFDEDGAVATRLVSVNSFGIQANRGAFNPAVSGNGRFVAFESRATNAAEVPEAGYSQIFVHDTHTGTTVLASKDANGNPAEADSFSPSLSAYGRYVAFTSNASNLTGGADNGVFDIYVHDRDNNRSGVWDESDGVSTVRVSAAYDGSGNEIPADAGSFAPSISDNGRFVAFSSAATNLPIGGLAGIDNEVSDVYVHDRDADGNGLYDETGAGDRTTVGVSVPDADVASGDTMPNYPDDATATDPSSLGSLEPSLSGDGRYVAFRSTANNLVDGDANGSSDVFVHDRMTGETALVSVNRFGEQTGQNFVNGDGSNSSRSAAISGDGRHIAFASESNNLVHGATNLVFLSENNKRDVFVHDRRTEGALADLEIVSIDYPAGIHPEGASVEVDVVLRNAGVAAVPDGTPVEVRLFLSPERVSGDGNDVFLDTGDFVLEGDLLAGEEVELSGFVTVPSNAPLGRFHLAAEAGRAFDGDRDTLVAEMNYRNNLRFSDSRDFSTNDLPDFTFTGDEPLVFEPGTYAPGSALPVSVTVVNDGAPNFDETEIEFHLSPDGDPANPDNVAFGQTLTVSGIGGTPKTVEGELIFPEAAVSGEDYFIIARINPGDDPVESDSANNVVSRPGIRVLDAPDLTLTGLNFDSFTTYAPEDSVQVTVSGENLNEVAPEKTFQVEVVFVDQSGEEFRQPNSAQNVSPGSLPFELTYDISLAGLPLGDYRVRAVADPDNVIEETDLTNNQIESSAANLRVFSPQPIVSLVSPGDGLTITSSSSVLMTAVVDSNKTIDRVEFRVDGSVLDVDTTSPYTVRFRPDTLGTKTLTAAAIDASGVEGESSPVEIDVVSSTSGAPTVSLVSPADGAEILAGVSVQLEAAASKPQGDGTIEEVTFYVNGFPVGSTSEEPYLLDRRFNSMGRFELRVSATDSSGNTVVSAESIIDVREQRPAEFDEDYVDFIYAFLLGRFPDSREKQEALDALNAGELTRAGLVLQQMEDPRFRALVDVWAAYDVSLGRLPESEDEIEAAAADIRASSVGLRNVVGGLLGSDEFVNKFGNSFHLMPAREFVETLYLNTGRTPTDEQLSDGEKALRNLTRSEYAVDFLRNVPDRRRAFYESGASIYAIRGPVPSEAEAAELAAVSREARVARLLAEEGLADSGSFVSWLDNFDDRHFDHRSESGWIHHDEHGWWYRPADARSWVWDHAMQDWIWTDGDIYPFVYRNSESAWFYYEEGGNPDLRWFYDYRSGDWTRVER